MATVTLGTVWLNLAADPSVYLSLPTMASLSATTAVPGEVRRMANGRMRSVTRAGSARGAEVDVENATRAEIDWLEAHVGDLVCVRDDRGRKFFGVYYSVPVEEMLGQPGYGGVSLSLAEVTHSEAV